MYAKTAYHDAHYNNVDDSAYLSSARMLREVLPAGARVLDYGCGMGAFLTTLRAVDLAPLGVEFDAEAAEAAGRRSGCEVLTVDAFWAHGSADFDAIHLGDVLEHLPDPAGVLRRLLSRLRPGGVLFGEGPLEVNPSLVYWCAALYGWVKHLAQPSFMASHPPTHLFRANSKQQLAFFLRVEPSLSIHRWVLYETGWPYAQGGKLKKVIASAAVWLSKHAPILGNRFRGLFFYRSPHATGMPCLEAPNPLQRE
jgi:SAM-dependent methyltransferase